MRQVNIYEDLSGLGTVCKNDKLQRKRLEESCWTRIVEFGCDFLLKFVKYLWVIWDLLALVHVKIFSHIKNFDPYEKHIDLCNQLCSSSWLAIFFDKICSSGHYSQTVEPNCFVSFLHVGIMDFNHSIPLSVTLTLHRKFVRWMAHTLHVWYVSRLSRCLCLHVWYVSRLPRCLVCFLVAH